MKGNVFELKYNPPVFKASQVLVFLYNIFIFSHNNPPPPFSIKGALFLLFRENIQVLNSQSTATFREDAKKFGIYRWSKTPPPLPELIS